MFLTLICALVFLIAILVLAAAHLCGVKYDIYALHLIQSLYSSFNHNIVISKAIRMLLACSLILGF